MRRHRTMVAFIALIGWAGIAVAAEQTILGKSLLVKDPKPGVDATKRKVTGTGKEKNSANTIVGNPTTLGLAGGGILQVFAFGATSALAANAALAESTSRLRASFAISSLWQMKSFVAK